MIQPLSARTELHMEQPLGIHPGMAAVWRNWSLFMQWCLFIVVSKVDKSLDDAVLPVDAQTCGGWQIY